MVRPEGLAELLKKVKTLEINAKNRFRKALSWKN